MASAKPGKCFTCFRQTDNFIRLTEPDDGFRGEDLHHHQEIFAKHFWFTKDQYYDKIVCGTCWERIEDFHRFYCDVERIHSAEQLLVKVELFDEVEDDCPTAKMECDEEPDHGVSGVFTEVLCKVEHAEDSNDDDQDYMHPKGKMDSDSESEQPLAKLETTRKSPKKQRLKKKTDLKRRNSFAFSCKLCVDAGAENVEPFTTFYRLSKHFREAHQSPPFVMCCGQKYTNSAGLTQHIKKHPEHQNVQNPSERCVECNVNFSTEQRLAQHMFLVHTPEDQKQFKCDLCSKAFADENLLRIHINWHEQVQQKNHYCAQCDRYFTNVGLLINHNETQHQTPPAVSKPDLADDASNNGSDQSESESKEKATPQSIANEDELIRKVLVLSCSECDAAVDTFGLLRKHGREAHGLKSMVVVCCERRFSCRSRLLEHCLFHLNPDAFECGLCKKSFPDKKALRNHKWSAHTPASERPFKCDICGDSFMKEYLLKLHIQRHVEMDRKIFQCQQCDKVLSNASFLRYHMHAVHGEVSSRAWICDICAKSFPHRSKLERHRLTHAPEGLAQMTEQCKTCNKWYSRKSLSTHRQRCGMAQPVKCDQCDHTAVNEPALRAHKKHRHTGRPKYPCSYCGKEFTMEIRLKEHVANHAGIVLYQCDFCPKTCNSSSNMYTHKKAAHPEQWAQKVASRRAPPPTAPQ